MIRKSTNIITLHVKELSISNVEFKKFTSSFKIKSLRFNPKAETAAFIFYKKIPKGKGELTLKFKGILNSKMRGFYKSSYEHQGKKKHLATTQFEATDARMAFPCFDEPAQKAIFDVTIFAPPGMQAISNTQETAVQEHSGGYRAIQFAPTPKMSTYLLAFIVGDFESIEGKTKSGVTVRVFVTPGKKHQAKFALGCAIKTLEFYNNYFDIPYPLPILDLIAIPDFSHGAMENWGAITYRESALLVDAEHSSAANKQWVALVIAHELAHQWFGNLVTMHWWTDLWLNEGFASYIEYLAIDHIFPHWDVWTQFAFNDLGVALKLDGLKSTHPIEVEVRHPDEIGEIFDEVSYSKGASVIRMLAAYLGEKDFRDGLRYYLKRHAYQNTKTTDLWTAFSRISKKPVSQIMRNWTRQPGYPVVKIFERPESYLLTQKRFFSSPLSKNFGAEKPLWQIPLKFQGTKQKSQSCLLGSQSLKLPKSKVGWVKFNLGESSFLRVDYPAQMLSALHSPIKNKQLPALDRLGIIRDAFALSESGDLPTVQALELCLAYVNETDYAVWVELISGLNALNNLLYGEPCHPDFQKYARKILSIIQKKVGWKSIKNESHTQGLLRSLILYAAGSFGEKSVIARARFLFNRWAGKNRAVDANLRSVVYNLGASNGSAKEHAFLVKAYQRESLHEEKNRIGRALGQFLEKSVINRSLKFALSKSVRLQDSAGIFISVWSNPAGRLEAWKFTKKNWPTLSRRYPASGHNLSKFIKPAVYCIAEKEGHELAGFFKVHKTLGVKRTLEQTLEKIYSNHAWKKRDFKKISVWLKKQ